MPDQGRPDQPGALAPLRRRVALEAGLVVAATVALETANVRYGLLPTLLAASGRGGVPFGDIVFVLAASHVLMLGFGARRAVELKRAFVQRQAATLQLQHQAGHDAVTGLANRTTLENAAQQALDQDVSAGPVGLLRVGLVGLAEVSATLGHVVRDDILAAFARRLEQVLAAPPVAGAGPRSLAASVAGDEFGVLLTGRDEPAVHAAAEQILLAAQQPLAVGSTLLELQIHIGVAVALPPDTASELLGRADVALAAAQVHGHGLQAYRADLDRRDPRNLSIYGELRQGISRGELRVHYQPKVSASTGRVSGVEALVRWQHPTRGLLLPGEFLDIAEQTGLVRLLTVAVLHQALADRARWAAQGTALPVAVNLSPRSLHDPALPTLVTDLLRQHHCPAHDLELEITETVAMQEPAQALAVLRRLRALGLHLSIDDYGTGHCSLSYLSQLPVTTLKIDRAFIAAMDHSDRDLAIVRSTLELAHGLGCHVVAEGIETQEAWTLLKAMHCDQAQGFWLSRPVPADDLLARIHELENRLASLTPLPHAPLPAPRAPRERAADPLRSAP